jgi:hypothetical protein
VRSVTVLPRPVKVGYETPGLSTQWSRSFTSLIRPLMAQLSEGSIAVARVPDVTAESTYARECEGAVMPLAAQESQRRLELALSQPALGSERQEVSLAQLPGMSIELGSSRRDQRRRSSALSASSSVARHYRSLDDDMELAHDGL